MKNPLLTYATAKVGRIYVGVESGIFKYKIIEMREETCDVILVNDKGEFYPSFTYKDCTYSLFYDNKSAEETAIRMSIECPRTILIFALYRHRMIANTVLPNVINRVTVDYYDVTIYGQTHEIPEITYIRRFENEPELMDSSYNKLLEFAKLKYMEYFDTDDWNIVYMEQLIETK